MMEGGGDKGEKELVVAGSVTFQELESRLKELGIDFEHNDHPPVWTVEESKKLRGNIQGIHVKNLFLMDKKKHLFLVTLEEERKVDLKELKTLLNANNSLRFASEWHLREHLGVVPGSVTPFAVINDKELKVTIALSSGLLSGGEGRGDVTRLNAHPLRNDMTLTLRPSDLLLFLRSSKHEPLILNFD